MGCYNSDEMLSPRQALVCAAVAGWRSDEASDWSSPNREDDILAWASSYGVPEDAELTQAFATLVKEGLFRRVLYSIFAQPVYHCSYDGAFLDELPENIGEWIPSATIPQLKAFWTERVEWLTERYGSAWLYWGFCTGQGSQSGSSPDIGPCLGTGCGCFELGDPDCVWELPFADIQRTGWLSTDFLQESPPNQKKIDRALTYWKSRLQKSA